MKTIKIIAFILILGVACFASYKAGQSVVYSQEFQYFNNTEVLLDSINNWNESFMDTVMETDVYYNYEKSRDLLL